jgi:predicted transposase YbfD/YdcC
MAVGRDRKIRLSEAELVEPANEDRSRIRKDHAPANLSVLHHMAVNLLK